MAKASRRGTRKAGERQSHACIHVYILHTYYILYTCIHSYILIKIYFDIFNYVYVCILHTCEFGYLQRPEVSGTKKLEL